MADDKEKKDKDEKGKKDEPEMETRATVDVEGKGEFEATATVKTPKDEKGEEKGAEVKDIKEAPSAPDDPGGTCIECGTQLFEGRCINADCPVGQAQASKGAQRPTAKATAVAAGGAQPRAFSRSGGVD